MKKVKIFYLPLLVFLLAPLAAFSAYESASPKIGVLFQPPKGDSKGLGIEYKMRLAKMVGTPYIRTEASNVNFDEKKLSQLQKAQNAGFKIILNLNNRIAGEKASSPPENIELYKQQVANILDRFKPELLVIENEENESLFYSGTPEQYLEQLEAAVEVAHARGVKVADGGLTSVEFALARYYAENGRKRESESLMNRTMKPHQIKNFLSDTMVPKRKRAIENERAVIAGLRNSKVDYIDLHWYTNDQQALEEVVNYLKNVTGKPVISTEIGQHDKSPETAENILTKAYQLGMPYIIWYSGDGTRAFALQENEDQLRPNGEAFKQFISNVQRQNNTR